MIKKKCHIHAIFPVTCFTVPIVGHTDLNLTPDEIYQCLCSKAEVSEYLPNGNTIDLDFSNYNKDNSPKLKVVEGVKVETQEVHIEESVVEETAKIEEVEETEEETTIVLEDKVEVQEEAKVEESPVKTHELSSRNNNKYNNNNHKKSKNKR